MTNMSETKFTDDDLKRLKAFRLQGYHTWTAFEQNEIVDLVDALLARLEAAEMCCQFMWISEHPIDDSSNDAYKAWRKAAGKSSELKFEEMSDLPNDHRELPEWIRKHKKLSDMHDAPIYEALAIAWEALEAASIDGLNYETIEGVALDAEDAMRQISDLDNGPRRGRCVVNHSFDKRCEGCDQ